LVISGEPEVPEVAEPEVEVPLLLEPELHAAAPATSARAASPAPSRLIYGKRMILL
jgi:hypothetical protein